MADENVLKEFSPGEVLKADDTNSNNHYLENKVTSLASKIESNISSVQSQLNTMFATLYPVGSIYITANNSCPMASVITNSKWELVGTGRALWCGNGSNANTTIAAGLPNITGGIVVNQGRSWGAFYDSGTDNIWGGGRSDNKQNGGRGFDASRSNSIYNQSKTVQPPAFVVNVYRRTA